MMENSYFDLTQRPPRSPRVRLGGFVVLARILDKCRAVLAGKNGEYNYDCPLDQTFLEFSGIEAEALKAEVAAGKGDGEILDWVKARLRSGVTDAEIAAWSAFQEAQSPSTTEKRQFFNEHHTEIAPHREDISTWFDLLDLDDHVSFGGKA